MRRIHVYPKWYNDSSSATEDDVEVQGEMSEEKRIRIRKALAAEGGLAQAQQKRALLTPDVLKKLAQIEHVQKLVPHVHFHEKILINDQMQCGSVESAAPAEPAYLRRIVAGHLFEDPTEASAVISEYLLYRSGIIDDNEAEAFIGKKITIEIRQPGPADRVSLRVYLSRPDGSRPTPDEIDLLTRLNEQIPRLIQQLDPGDKDFGLLKQIIESQAVQPPEELTTVSREFTIVGVIRQSTEEELNDRRWWDFLGGASDVFLPYQTAADFFFSSPATSRHGLNHLEVIAESEEYVKTIARQIKEQGLQADAPIEFIERERFLWGLVFGGMTCIAAVALLIAALGIANTMLMSVLERTREIGIMKALGASEAAIQTIFLIEGILIGAVGGTIGLLLAVVASVFGDAWVRQRIQSDMNLKLDDALFVFPAWIVATVILFAALVTTAAAYYPARRAAHIDPVGALRHE